MKKSELEAKVAKLQKVNKIYEDALLEIRQSARDIAAKGSNINLIYIIEKVTVAVTKGSL